MDGDLLFEGAGAAFMLVTLFGIFGTLAFFFNRCANQFAGAGAGAGARAAERVPAEVEAGQAQAQGGLLPFYVFWRAFPSLQWGRPAGLADSAIAALPLTKLAQAAECAVCLGELAAGEAARLLPPCGHTFHVECVDTWLRSRANCPLCRQTVNEMPRNVEDAQPAAPAPAQAQGAILLPPALPLAQARDGQQSHISLEVLD